MLHQGFWAWSPVRPRRCQRRLHPGGAAGGAGDPRGDGCRGAARLPGPGVHDSRQCRQRGRNGGRQGLRSGSGH